MNFLQAQVIQQNQVVGAGWRRLLYVLAQMPDHLLLKKSCSFIFYFFFLFSEMQISYGRENSLRPSDIMHFSDRLVTHQLVSARWSDH